MPRTPVDNSAAAQGGVAIVAPVFGNASTLRPLAHGVEGALGPGADAYRLVFVVDASPDGSWEVVQRLCAEDTRVAGLLLARNVGQHRAILAGLASARARLNVVMDADLQDPPALIPELLARARDTGRTVFARRRGRYERWDRLVTSRLFKGMLQRLIGLPRDVGTFFVVDDAVAAAMVRHAGPSAQAVVLAHRYSPGWQAVDFVRARRQGGGSAYSTTARVRAAVLAIRCARACRRADRGAVAGAAAPAPVAARVNL